MPPMVTGCTPTTVISAVLDWNPHGVTGGDANGAMYGGLDVAEVLGHIADRHSTRDSYIEDARRDLEEARQFVGQKHL